MKREGEEGDGRKKEDEDLEGLMYTDRGEEPVMGN